MHFLQSSVLARAVNPEAFSQYRDFGTEDRQSRINPGIGFIVSDITFRLFFVV